MIDATERDGVAHIALNRPDKRNALTPAMTDDLLSALRRAAESRTARAILLTGRGDAFCAGFDLKMCHDTPGTLERLLRGLSDAIRVMRRTDTPVVLSAHGAAIAGGCALLGGADAVITERGAKLGYPVVTLGISPAVSAPSLADLVGVGPARERLLEPRVFGGEEATRLGLAHECAEDAATCNSRAHTIAYNLASKPPHSLATTKRWLREIDGAENDTPFDRALGASLSLLGSSEQRDALAKLWGSQ